MAKSGNSNSDVVTARDVAAFVEEIAPLETCCPGDERGFVFGCPETEVRGVVVCWSPTLEVIQKTLDQGPNMIVTHESLLYTGTDFPPIFPFKRMELKIPNRRRMALLFEHDICVYRAHTNWDVAQGGVLDALVALLELREIEKRPFYRICEAEATTVEEWATKIKEKIGLEAVRVVGELDRKVQRIGVVGGGSGASYHFIEDAADQRVEFFVCGDLTDYTARYALEVGMALIDVTHAASENFGLINLADRIKKQFPHIKTTFIDTGIPWVHL